MVSVSDNVVIVIVYCSENNYVENIVSTFGRIIKETTGHHVEFISDGRVIEPRKKILFVVTEGIHQISHVYSDGNYDDYRSNKAFSSGKAFLERIKDDKSAQHLMVLMSPIVSMNWLHCCMFKNKDVPLLYHITDNEQVQLDVEKLVFLLENLCENSTFCQQIRSKLERYQEILNLKNQLLALYLYMRDNQKWFEEDFLGCYFDEDSHQTQPLLPYSIQQSNCVQQVTYKMNSPINKSGLHRERPQTQTLQQVTRTCYLPNKSAEKINPENRSREDPDFFDSGISEMKLEVNTKEYGRHDSGVDSVPLDEMSPFTVGSPDFFPPDSDTDSADVDALSLGQHMLEINKRNLEVW